MLENTKVSGVTARHGNAKPYINRGLARRAEISRANVPMAVQ